MYKADAAQTMKSPRVVATAFSSDGGFVRMTACVSDQCSACTKRAFRLEEACNSSNLNLLGLLLFLIQNCDLYFPATSLTGSL